MRPSRAAALAVAALAALLAVAPAHPAAAASPTVVVQRTDPLMTDPLQVRVAVAQADGGSPSFSASLKLAVGRTATTQTASGTGAALVSLPTGGLPSGSATLTVRVSTATGTRTVALPGFATIVSGLEVTGFGCTAVPRSGASIGWAVSRMNGDPVAHPVTQDRWPRLPYTGTGGLLLMRDVRGKPLTTSGRMTVLAGTRVVASVPLAAAVRRLTFAVPWNGRVAGRFAPGAYTAQLVLKDAAGRTATAVQPVAVVTAGVLPCG